MPLRSTQPFGIIQSSTPNFGQSTPAFDSNLFLCDTSTPVFGQGMFGQPTQQNRIEATLVTSKFDQTLELNEGTRQKIGEWNDFKPKLVKQSTRETDVKTQSNVWLWLYKKQTSAYEDLAKEESTWSRDIVYKSGC